MAAVANQVAAVSKQIQVRARVFADEGSEESLMLHKALGVMLVVLKSGRRWVRYAAAHESVDGKPGDCLFLPPACLMDLDEADASIAKQWRLAVGRLTNPDDGSLFTHCWLEFGEAAVSVSNLKNGYPAYARTRSDYYRFNGVVGDPVFISARSLRVTGRRLNGGPDLAKWIAAKVDQ
jgi:hypothetical protein